jgi:hypothetical protein
MSCHILVLWSLAVWASCCCSFVKSDPHLRKDLSGILKVRQKHVVRTPEAKKDRILKLVRASRYCLSEYIVFSYSCALLFKQPSLEYDPGFDQFSGYLTVSRQNGRYIFYWYVESQGNPSTDPVVLWTNGGPGCSGLLGFGTEHGPFLIHKNGTVSRLILTRGTSLPISSMSNSRQEWDFRIRIPRKITIRETPRRQWTIMHSL